MLPQGRGGTTCTEAMAAPYVVSARDRMPSGPTSVSLLGMSAETGHNEYPLWPRSWAFVLGVGGGAAAGGTCGCPTAV
jgi:hypothetical protein